MTYHQWSTDNNCQTDMIAYLSFPVFMRHHKNMLQKYAPFDIHFLSVIRNMALILSFVVWHISLYREWLLRNTLCYKFHQCTFGVAFDVQNSLSLLLFLQNFLFLSFVNNANRQGKCLHHLWWNYRHGYSNMKAPE